MAQRGLTHLCLAGSGLQSHRSARRSDAEVVLAGGVGTKGEQRKDVPRGTGVRSLLSRSSTKTSSTTLPSRAQRPRGLPQSPGALGGAFGIIRALLHVVTTLGFRGAL